MGKNWEKINIPTSRAPWKRSSKEGCAEALESSQGVSGTKQGSALHCCDNHAGDKLQKLKSCLLKKLKNKKILKNRAKTEILKIPRKPKVPDPSYWMRLGAAAHAINTAAIRNKSLLFKGTNRFWLGWRQWLHPSCLQAHEQLGSLQWWRRTAPGTCSTCSKVAERLDPHQLIKPLD